MRILLLAVILALAPVLPAPALSISLVYQNPGDSFFTPEVQATLNKAASDVSSAITTSLAAVSQNSYSGTHGSTTAGSQWNLSYNDPTAPGVLSLSSFNLAANEFRIFVGTQILEENTLGHGSAGGIGLSLNGSGQESEWQNAVSTMQSNSNAAMTRNGPLLGSISGNVPFGSTSAAFTLNYGYMVGSLTIDSSKSWNLSYDSLPTATQNDLYSVAVHEILHDLGFGTVRAWDDHVDGFNWTGASVINLLGSGSNVLSENSDHIAEGLFGRPLIDGVFQTGQFQEALMDPTLTLGSRKYLTDLDLAFLQDLGWNVQPIPEPSTWAFLGLGLAALLALAHRRRFRPRA